MVDEVYAPDEIAEAAGVPVEDVLRALESGKSITFRGFLGQADAVLLVQRLKAGVEPPASDRAPMSMTTHRRRPVAPGLTVSGFCHAVALALILFISSTAWLTDEEVKAAAKPPESARLVFFVAPGPGGGGGGSGMNKPKPPPLARRAPEKPKLVVKVSSPVPPVRRVVPPRPQPVERPVPKPPVEVPRVEPLKTETPPPPPAVQAPVVTAPADPVSSAGVLNGKPDVPPAGSGTGGLPGTGRGAGMGEGEGPGIGPGSGGGTGGGPYRPGSGVEAPRILKEVRALYTDEARRRGIEGDVVLEVIVTQAGSVDRVRVVRGLGAGLDQNAIAAVKQWKFDPARRKGVPVDVVVEVSVEFRMRDF
jgi:TonB family protein